MILIFKFKIINSVYDYTNFMFFLGRVFPFILKDKKCIYLFCLLKNKNSFNICYYF